MQDPEEITRFCHCKPHLVSNTPGPERSNGAELSLYRDPLPRVLGPRARQFGVHQRVCELVNAHVQQLLVLPAPPLRGHQRRQRRARALLRLARLLQDLCSGPGRRGMMRGVVVEGRGGVARGAQLGERLASKRAQLAGNKGAGELSPLRGTGQGTNAALRGVRAELVLVLVRVRARVGLGRAAHELSLHVGEADEVHLLQRRARMLADRVPRDLQHLAPAARAAEHARAWGCGLGLTAHSLKHHRPNPGHSIAASRAL